MTAWDDVVEAARASAAQLQVPGVALGLALGDDERTAAFGVTSVENPLEVTADTLFQVGSVTKTFTGTVAMILAERGELDLDAPVRAYLPELALADAGAAARVTTRHLLTHTAGWVGDYFADFGAGDDALERMVGALGTLPQLTPLGEIWSYNNAAFYIAGRVIEKVTGRTYEDAVRELVLEPLGMESSFFFAEDVMTRRFVVGHVAPPDGEPEVARPWPIGRAHHAAGGIASSVRDMLRYARFHLGLLEGPLSAAGRAAMRERQAEAGTFADEIGLTWFIRHLDGATFYGHGGTTLGQNAWVDLQPERGYALVVLTNSSSGGALAREVTRAARERVLGVEEHEPEQRASTPEELAAYAGTYETALGTYRLTLDGEHLVLTTEPKGGFPKPDSPPLPAPPPTRVAFVADDRVVALDPPLAALRGEFLRGADGAVEWFRFGGRIARRAEVHREETETTTRTRRY